MNNDRKEHWEAVYNKKSFDEVTWYQPEPKQSLKLIKQYISNLDARILDVGAGSSTLSDYLLKEGYRNISLLDISASAFDQSKQRLGSKADELNWLIGDITNFDFNQDYDLWHDRAVFHFLVNSEDQEKYIQTLKDTLRSSGIFIISTFAEDGPLKCSGLEIVRYSKDELIHRVGDEFELLEFCKEEHVAPHGLEQKFNYWVFKKRTD